MKQIWLALAGLGLLSAGPALAQNPYDPPTSIRPPPNVMLLMDATRTTMINGATCRGVCHAEAGCGGEWDCGIYASGETRLQLARRVLTGGWGWNTAHVDVPNGPADAQLRTDGVMDQYKVRWGVTYYDGLGTRLVLDPTADNLLAQKSVIDFGHPGRNEALFKTGGAVPIALPVLNSFVPFMRTTACCGNGQSATYSPAGSLPWRDFAATRAESRQAAALQFVRDYFQYGVSPPTFDPSSINAQTAAYFDPGVAANDATVIDGDPANVMSNLPPAGCRRNFTIMLLDGHGEQNWAGLSNGASAASIYNLHTQDDPAADHMPPATLANQVFSIHFGVQNSSEADKIADGGYDGLLGNGAGITTTFEGAPGGSITNLSAMYAAFASIFSLVLHGTYIGAPPTVTRYGTNLAVSKFTIQDCTGLRPDECNIGRPGSLEWWTLNAAGAEQSLLWDAGDKLRSHRYDRRNIYTSLNASEANCGTAGTCAGGATMSQVTGSSPFNTEPFGGWRTDGDFLLGRPDARFANGVFRGDTTSPHVNDPNYDPYKLMDVANSAPVVVGAPSGIGEDIERWKAFLAMNTVRNAAFNGDGSSVTVKKRDQVVYIGSNDGMIHAFLASRDNGATPPPGRTTNYAAVAPCASSAGTNPPQNDQNYCGGVELWGYAPRMLQPYWSSIRGGHYFMVDGTPIVTDVLFTKNTNVPGAVCTSLGSCGAAWEYRTVALECLGGGGPGCFALDVTNPFNPQLLWERAFTAYGGRGTSTSKPQVARVRRTVGGQAIPYYVALMGGGLNETNAGSRRGTFFAVGLEDGVIYSSAGSALGASYGRADFAGGPTCLDTNDNGFVDTCYIATTDAAIYKIRMDNDDPARMQMALFYDGRAATGSATIHSYGRVAAAYDTMKRITLFFATGNFEDVQNATEQNYIFKVTDATPSAVPVANGGNGTTSCAGATGVYSMPVGEKVVFDPAFSSGVVYFTSFQPNANPCLPGNGYLYGFTYDACAAGIDSDGNGSADTTKISVGNGLPTAPVINETAGKVIVALDDGSVLPQIANTPPQIQIPMQKLWWRTIR
ncbi:MAG: PilC/PilY family type IV pilus protein [Myxococcota bacterium]